MGCAILLEWFDLGSLDISWTWFGVQIAAGITTKTENTLTAESLQQVMVSLSKEGENKFFKVSFFFSSYWPFPNYVNVSLGTLVQLMMVHLLKPHSKFLRSWNSLTFFVFIEFNLNLLKWIFKIGFLTRSMFLRRFWLCNCILEFQFEMAWNYYNFLHLMQKMRKY